MVDPVKMSAQGDEISSEEGMSPAGLSSQRRSSDHQPGHSPESPLNAVSRTVSRSVSPPIRRTASDDCIVVVDPTLASNLTKYLVSGSNSGISCLEVNTAEVNLKQNKNTVLHVAASAGQAELIKKMFPKWEGVIEKANSKGDLAFHTAAKAGRLDALKELINAVKERKIDSLLGRKNNAGDTPLHIALEKNQVDMAWYLVDEYWRACYELNKKEVSPLYLAIKAGYSELVLHIISFTKIHSDELENVLFHAKSSIVHAAIERNNIVMLKAVLGNHQKMIEKLDETNNLMTPLSYAASIGYLEGVEYLLEEFDGYTFTNDVDGSFPIHHAASGGHIKVVESLPSMIEMLNDKDQNILHTAAMNGKSKLVSYILSDKKLKWMLNRKDEDGNTPLHLAAKEFHPRVVYMLTRTKGVMLGLLNKDGVTALDLAEIHAGPTSNFEMRLTWMALRYVDAPRSSQSNRKNYLRKIEQAIDEEEECLDQKKSGEEEDGKKSEVEGGKKSSSKRKDDNDDRKRAGQVVDKQKTKIAKQERAAIYKDRMESYTNRIDTLILVATLVATVSFAAGFTLPGGYKQDDPSIGMAILAKKRAFQAFVICNTAAMYTSTLAVVIFIWAQLGELKLMQLSLKLGLVVLGFALTMMSVAFVMAVFVVLKDLPWLSYVVLGMGCFLSILVLVVFIPLYNPSYIKNNPIKRFFFTGTFLMLLLVSEKSQPTYKKY